MLSQMVYIHVLHTCSYAVPTSHQVTTRPNTYWETVPTTVEEHFLWPYYIPLPTPGPTDSMVYLPYKQYDNYSKVQQMYLWTLGHYRYKWSLVNQIWWGFDHTSMQLRWQIFYHAGLLVLPTYQTHQLQLCIWSAPMTQQAYLQWGW